MVVDAPKQNRIDLDGGESGVLGGPDPSQDVMESVAQRQLAEGVGIEGVQADVHAPQTGGRQVSANAGSLIPFVVNDTRVPGNETMPAITSATSVVQAAAHPGEPRTVLIPRRVAIPISRRSSSVERRYSPGIQASPSAGMQ